VKKARLLLKELAEAEPQTKNMSHWQILHWMRRAQGIDETLRYKLSFLLGGWYAHNLYFEGILPTGAANEPGTDGSYRLFSAIKQDFQSVDKFKRHLQERVLDTQGSGWVWLVLGFDARLHVITSHDQYVPDGVLTPIMVCDVWEHAYYLKHRNERSTYFRDWWLSIRWHKVNTRYEAALAVTSSALSSQGHHPLAHEDL
jgi:superoxide dismutase